MEFLRWISDLFRTDVIEVSFDSRAAPPYRVVAQTGAVQVAADDAEVRVIFRETSGSCTLVDGPSRLTVTRNGAGTVLVKTEVGDFPPDVEMRRVSARCPLLFLDSRGRHAIVSRVPCSRFAAPKPATA